MQKARSDLRKRGCWPLSRASCRKGERRRTLLGVFLAMFLLVSGVAWPVCSPVTDGDLKWSYIAEGPVSSSSAIASNGTIYVGSSDGKLHAINPGGIFRWKSAYTTGGPVSSSPAIASNGTIYVGSDDGRLYAINPNGTLQWAYSTGGYVHSSRPSV